MTPEYLSHYMVLISSVTILNGNSVSRAMVNVAKKKLRLYVKLFPDLYDEKLCSINSHILLHIGGKVFSLGPLWGHSCFSFENLNGLMVKDMHGPTNADSQIVNMYWQNLLLNSRVQNLPEGPIRDFAKSRKKQVKIIERFDNFSTVGIYTEFNLKEDSIITKSLNNLHVQGVFYLQYFRLLVNGMLFIS